MLGNACEYKWGLPEPDLLDEISFTRLCDLRRPQRCSLWPRTLRLYEISGWDPGLDCLSRRQIQRGRVESQHPNGIFLVEFRRLPLLWAANSSRPGFAYPFGRYVYSCPVQCHYSSTGRYDSLGYLGATPFADQPMGVGILRRHESMELRNECIGAPVFNELC